MNQTTVVLPDAGVLGDEVEVIVEGVGIVDATEGFWRD
jgi:hypothetical protein